MATGFTIEHRDQTCVVALQTDLTAALVGDLRAAVREVLEGGATDLEFDFGHVGMLDSSGIGLLIATANTLARAGGRVHVVKVSKDISQLLQSMRLTGRLDVRARD